ncbi:CoA transferase [Knoellia aerolata]|uniref:Acyl-CoA transferase n=1 Tax=Knoellia aerolata DSM 18566 TaxID=1385519 RepID=A0A0A0JZ44_9MICO|nr:CoA transferase [Knoellia aerolata]KGN41979.1 acyl-CoA transferase [Knoellia aerolata DSM 18566]
MSLAKGIVGQSVASQHARRMVAALAPVVGPAVTVDVDLDSAPSPEEDWTTSGGRSLTGYPTERPLGARGHPASAVRAALAWLRALQRASAPAGADTLPGIELLGERAEHLRLSRNAPWSCGGAMTIVPCAHGHLAVSLARPSDVELLPAALERPVEDDAWTALRAWSSTRPAVEAAARLQLLGIPAAPVGVHDGLPARPWLVATPGGRRSPSRRGGRPRVVDLTSLWAGPLCARLLRCAGADVVKVESVHRPDGARSGSPSFFDLLNGGSEQVSLDLHARAGVAHLRALINDADVVLEASRPRALAHLGLDAGDVVAAGTTWLSITARGRESPWVGFGDDIAAGAGLLAQSDAPLPAGDALADPLAGVHAAVAVTAALTSDRAWLLDLSMHDVARMCADDVEPATPNAERRTP